MVLRFIPSNKADVPRIYNTTTLHHSRVTIVYYREDYLLLENIEVSCYDVLQYSPSDVSEAQLVYIEAKK